jgi:hypothetical protein
VSEQSAEDGIWSHIKGEQVDAFFVQHGPPAQKFTMREGWTEWMWNSQQVNLANPSESYASLQSNGAGGVAGTVTTYGGGTTTLE